jgi:2'-deoxynucleoside 5'-phosphate N-hydrolase
MRAFVSIKFWGDDRNRSEVELVCGVLEGLGIDTFCFRRDAERFGQAEFSPSEMMAATFKEIDRADLVIAHVGEWAIGVGVEAGYARGHEKPVVCICPAGKTVARTVSGIAAATIVYDGPEDLTVKLKDCLARQAFAGGDKSRA